MLREGPQRFQLWAPAEIGFSVGRGQTVPLPDPTFQEKTFTLGRLVGTQAPASTKGASEKEAEGEK